MFDLSLICYNMHCRCHNKNILCNIIWLFLFNYPGVRRESKWFNRHFPCTYYIHYTMKCTMREIESQSRNNNYYELQ